MGVADLHAIIQRDSMAKITPSVATRWETLNKILGGGIPPGRIVEVWGPSQIGKSALILQMFPGRKMVYFDLDRKLCHEYVDARKADVHVDQSLNEDKLFDCISEVVRLDVLIAIDSLPMLGKIEDDTERFRWLASRFARLQRQLVDTKSIVLVANQMRVVPSTGRTYNPHEGCLDAAVKLKMYRAEQRGRGKLVYIEVEKSFWGHEGNRCTVLVTKTDVTERK